MSRSFRAIVFASLVACFASMAQAQPLRRGVVVVGADGKGTVNLPYRPPQADAFGNTWYIYQGGWLQHQGNMQAISQGAMLMINGNQPNMPNNTARLEASGELVLDNLTAQGCTVTRRIYIDRENGFVRFIDVFKNTTAAELILPVMYRSSINYGIQNAQNIPDPKKKENSMGTVVNDGQNRAILELYSGRGSKVAAQVLGQQNNNMIQASYSLSIPAGKEVALMHLHTVMPSADAAMKLVGALKESKLLADVPKPVRRLIANFAGGNLFIGDGDIEILRGEAFDVAEMRTGDQMKGTLKDQSFKLATFYGTIELPADKVVALVNVGESRPRQLLVTVDGQIFGGKLEKETIDLELSSGQVTKLPLSQITRVGYRKRSGEPEEWNFDKPTVMLRSGERIGVKLPADDIIVVTRYGSLKLKPTSIGSIAFQNEENGVHEIYLTDGSKFAGLVSAETFELQLGEASGTKEQIVKIPSSTIARLQLNAKVDDADDTTSTLKLANEDLLVASLSGQYKLGTAFDVLTLSGEQIKTITHSKTSPLDVVVRLWDETSVSGQLEQQELTCLLKSGVTLKVPVALVAEYNQPQPKPADSMVEKVKQVVERLNADDWKARDEAQKQLVAMGPAVSAILKQLRAAQPPEAQQRIDDVLSTLKGAPTPGVNAAPDN